MSIILTILFGCLSTVGFSVLFHLRPKYIVFSTIASLIACTTYVLLDLLDIGIFFPNFIATVLTVVYVEIISRVIKVPSSIIQLPGILPLIPGKALYYSMTYILAENYTLAFENALILVKTALGIAIGITITSVCFRTVWTLIHNRKQV